VVEVAAYRTVPDNADAERLRHLLHANEVDVVAFTASSTVRNYVDAVGSWVGQARVASIGPVTSRTAREMGLPVHMEATEHTIPGLIHTMQNYFDAEPGAGAE
jgi:uroporphyrinogen III methyltransferase/synthase